MEREPRAAKATPDSSPTFEVLKNAPDLVGTLQRSLAGRWAARYYGSTSDSPDKRAKIMLANPSAYINKVSISKLPETLQEGWSELLTQADSIVDESGCLDVDLNPTMHGLERLEWVVGNAEISEDLRLGVAAIMVRSANLFAESIKFLPEDTPYYADNILAAHSQFPRETVE